MFARLLVVLLVTPIVELALLIQLGGLIGFWPTVALIAATAVVGTYLLRREGAAAWKRFNERLRAGALPGNELIDGVIILVAGVLLVTPGVLTDLMGLAGLFAPTRALIRRYVSLRVQRGVAHGITGIRFGGPVVDADAGGSEPGQPTANSWRGARTDVPGHRRSPKEPDGASR